MNESTETESTESAGLILRSFVSRDLTGIVLSVAGAYGSLVFPGRLGIVLAAVSGIGALLIFTSDATNSTNAAGYFFALGSWSLLALSGITVRVAIPTMITAFWFGFKAERKIMLEAIDT